MTSTEVGALLRMCREMAGLSQDALAQQLHSNRNTISRIENGKDMPEIDLIVNWAIATRATGIVEAYLSQQLRGQEQAQAFFQIMHAIRDVAAALSKFQIA
jgi:transcriptional regulator with XRE-family HTH domain